jgi:hypothetical protein
LQELGEGMKPLKTQASNIWSMMLNDLSLPLKLII